jgi:hypothetical protein
MGADRTLVDAAFTEAKTRYGGDVIDKSNLYQSTKDISKGYLDLTTNIMAGYKAKKLVKRTALEGQLAKFTAIAEDGLQQLYEQDLPMPEKVVDAIEGKIRGLQDEFETYNTIGKGDTTENKRARRRITGELSRIVKEAVNLRGTFQKLGVEAKDIDLSRVNENKIDAATMMIDLKNMDGNDDVVVGYGENGIEITASNYWNDANSKWGDAVTMTSKDIVEAFPIKNFEWDTKYMANVVVTETTGTSDGQKGEYDYKIKSKRSDFIGTVRTKDEFSNISQRPAEGLGTQSFKDALMDDIGISIDVLGSMFYDDEGTRYDVGSVFTELDKNNDGMVNGEDMALAKAMGEEAYGSFEANMDAMIDAVVNVDNPAFSLSRSQELLADYYIGKEAEGNNPAIIGVDQQKYNAAFSEAERVKKNQERISRGNNKGEETRININGVSQEIKHVDNKIDKFNQGNVPVEDWYGNTWTPISNVNGSVTYEMDGKDKDGNIPTMTRNQLMRGRYFGLSNRLDDKHEGAHPFDEIEIPKTTVIPESLNYESTFKAPDGNKVSGESFIGKPEHTVNVLNNTYNTDVFIYSSKHPNKVIVKNPKSEANDLVFLVRNQAEIEKLLQTVSELFSPNTEYQE